MKQRSSANYQPVYQLSEKVKIIAINQTPIAQFH